jgi:hypothetical protein
MEAAFRTCNLALLLGAGDDAPNRTVLDWLAAEARFVLDHLERTSRNNHYLVDLVALLIASHVLPFLTPREESALHASFREVLRDQFLADGADFEASTGYHFLAMEALAAAALVNPEAAAIVQDEAAWIPRAIALMRLLLDDEGGILQIGDDDGSSCFWPLAASRVRAFQCAFCERAFGSAPSTLGATEYYPQFGLAIADRGPARIFLYGTQNRQNGKGGHAHNDKLAFALSLAGHPVFIDSGTFRYRRGRNRFRSAEAHGTLVINGREPCPLDRGAFCLPDTAMAEVKIDGPDLWTGTAMYAGARFRRRIHLLPDRVRVEDRLTDRPSSCRATSQLIVAPGLQPVCGSPGLVAIHTPNGRTVVLRSGGEVRIVPHCVCPRYDQPVRTVKIQSVWPPEAQEINWEVQWN